MADNSLLINKICEMSGLTGDKLVEYKASLAKMSYAQLQSELSSIENNAKYTGGSTFGYGFNSDWGMGVTIQRENTSTFDTSQVLGAITTSGEEEASLNFLKTITGEADAIFQNQENEAGVISGVVNTWHEIFNEEIAKSTVSKELKEAKKGNELLEKAMYGQLTKFNYVTGKDEVVSYQDEFYKLRGVKFDAKAIEDCYNKSEDYAQIKTAVDMINKTKEVLAQTTKGDVSSQMAPEKSAQAILKAFNLCGVKSLKNINDVISVIEEKYKDDPNIKKYGGDLCFAKNKSGKYVLYRKAKNGYPAEATNEELRLIAREMCLNLDKTLASSLGIAYKENATPEEMAALTQQTLDSYKRDYEDSFAKAYGKKDLKILTETYVARQQQGVANIEMGINILSTALMLVPGGAVATGGWMLKGATALNMSSKVIKGFELGIKGAQGIQKAMDACIKFGKFKIPVKALIMANMTFNFPNLTEQWTSENGMSKEEWREFEKGVLQNIAYMFVGGKVSKIAEDLANVYKTKALVNVLQNSGKSLDEISAMVKSNPAGFDAGIVKSLSRVDVLAKALQVSSETALDISTTYALNKMLGNGELTKQDWITSIAFALNGGVIQKQIKPMSTEAKVKYLQDFFRQTDSGFKLSAEDAKNILDTMDAISNGTFKGVDAENVKPQEADAQQKPDGTKPENDESWMEFKEVEEPEKNVFLTSIKSMFKDDAGFYDYVQDFLGRIDEKTAKEFFLNSGYNGDFDIQTGKKLTPQEKLKDVKKNIQKFINQNDPKLILNDIHDAIKTVKDEKILEFVNQITSTSNDVESLKKAREIVDIYNIMNGHYTAIVKANGTRPYYRDYIDFIKKTDNLNNTKDRNADLEKDMRIGVLVDYCKRNNDEVAKYFYENYYLKNEKLTEWEKKACLDIQEKYGTKVFLSATDLYTDTALKFVDSELGKWKVASSNTAKMPPVLDLMKAKQDYVNPTSAYGKSAAAGFAEGYGMAISIDGIENLAYSLRHELMHINDLKRGVPLPKDFPTAQTKVAKLFKHKYAKELYESGVPAIKVQYAFNNSDELIAVAAEGDMSKYSPEFKQVLVDLGMPSWAFKLDNPKQGLVEFARQEGKTIGEGFFKENENKYYNKVHSPQTEIRLQDVKPNDVKPNEADVKREAEVKPNNVKFKKSDAKFQALLKNYNNKKISGVEQYHRQIEMLDNWHDEYGIADSQGVYRNAINKLVEENGALDQYIDTILPNSSKETKLNAKNLLVKYLEQNLDIYSYDRINSILLSFDNVIKQKGDNTIIYIPDETKSYSLISYMYSKINPNIQSVTGWHNLSEFLKNNPNAKIVVLDDCIGCGKSAEDVYNTITKISPKAPDIDWFVCVANQKGLDYLQEKVPNLKVHYDGSPKLSLEDTDFYKNLILNIDKEKEKSIQQRFLKTILRYKDSNPDYVTGAAIMFPYMAPNNNTIFAAQMIKELFTGPNIAIKNIEKILYKDKYGQLEYPPTFLKMLLGVQKNSEVNNNV